MELHPSSSLRAEMFKRQIQSTILILLLLGAIDLAQMITNYWVDINERMDQQASTLQLTLIPAIQFQDEKEAQASLEALKGDARYQRAVVEIRGENFAHYAVDNVQNSQRLIPGVGWRSLIKIYPLRDKDEVIGYLYLERSHSVLFRSMSVFAIFMLIMIGFGLVVSLTFARLFRKIIIESFQSMTDQMEALKANPNAMNFNAEALSPYQEINKVLEKFNAMAVALQQRDSELLTANSQLESKIDERTQQLKELQVRLIEEAHKAGMADTAASVLHNFGNILSSLNIDASTLHEFIRGSRIAESLDQLQALLGNAQKVAELAKDQQKMDTLVDFIDCLVQAEKAEQSSSLNFLKKIREETDLMKGLIHFQQTYVSSPMHFQVMPILEVIQQTLDIKEAIIKTHGVAISVNVPGDLIVHLQKTKFIHVLTNLIINAIHAMKDTVLEDKMIDISCENKDDEVRLIIRDFGSGIKPTHVTKIFQQGFTTKKDGHGFGLHSSANYMGEMRGRLDLLDPQPQVGAAFVITLQKAGTKQKAQEESKDSEVSKTA